MRFALSVCALALCTTLPATAAVLNFEGIADLEPVGAFYSGVSFTNATAYVAGFSLNDALLPPASGTTVAISDPGFISIDWVNPISSFSGLFTYSGGLNLTFSLNGTTVGTAASLFENNLALGGDAGSLPNELISFLRPAGFDSVLIESRGIYGVDDIEYEAAQVVVPEPSTFFTLAAGIATLALFQPAKRALRRRSGN